MNKEQMKIRKKCFAIGFKLIAGPRAIFPPRAIDDFGWLEADLKITLTSHDYKKLESVSIFVDDTMNRDDSFLEPIIRYCIWERHKDETGNNSWPSIQLLYSHITNKKAADKKIRTLQKAIAKFDFKELGLSLKRDVAQVDIDYQQPLFDVFSRNGIQGITINSGAIKGDQLCETVFDLTRYFKKALKPIDQAGWRERYNQNLRKDFPAKSWDMEL